MPLNGDAVSGVFATEAYKAGHADGADLFEANQADAADGAAIVKFGVEFGRELALDNFRVDSEVDEHSTTDDALDSREFHTVNAASQSFQTGS